MSDMLRVTSRRLAGAPVEDRTITFVLSTDIEDRAGDTINQTGWKLERYLANPVVLWGHNHSLPAIGRMARVGLDTPGLVGAVRFADAEQHPFADVVYRLVEGDFISAGSVGFIPLRWEYREDRGIDFREQELIEYSVVNIPMNPDCLARAVQSGIDIAPLVRAAGAENAGSYVDLRKKLLESSSNPPRPPTPNLATLRARASHTDLLLRL